MLSRVFLGALLLCLSLAGAHAQSISKLPGASTITGSELLPIVQAGETRQATFDQVEDFIEVQFGAAAVEDTPTTGDFFFMYGANGLRRVDYSDLVSGTFDGNYTINGQLVLAGPSPIITLTDNSEESSPNFPDSEFNANTGTGSVTIGADVNNEQSGSEVRFAVDGTTKWVVTAGGALQPNVNDGGALGQTTRRVSDIHLAAGAVLTAGPSGSTDWQATHSTGILTVGTGDLRVTTAGTNTASVVTVGGTQTLTGKTLTSPVIGTSPTAAGATWTDLGAVTTVDINGGTIDGTTIGATSAAAGTFTSATTTGNVEVGHASDTSIARAAAGAITVEGLPVWRVLASSAVGVSHTGDTNETTLATITVPAGAMGANGRLRITTVWGKVGTAGTFTVAHKFGGTSFHSTSPAASTLASRFQVEISNRNSATSQIGAPPVGIGFGNQTSANVTASIDTTSAQDIVITGTLGNSGDTLSLESYLVEIMYKG